MDTITEAKVADRTNIFTWVDADGLEERVSRDVAFALIQEDDISVEGARIFADDTTGMTATQWDCSRDFAIGVLVVMELDGRASEAKGLRFIKEHVDQDVLDRLERVAADERDDEVRWEKHKRAYSVGGRQ